MRAKLYVEFDSDKEAQEFIDRAFPTGPTPSTVITSEVTEPKPKPKRKRRTKAQIEADKKAEEAAKTAAKTEAVDGDTSNGNTSVSGGPVEPSAVSDVVNNDLTIEDVKSAILKKAEEIGGEAVVNIVKTQTGSSDVSSIPPSLYFKVVEALK